MIKNFVDHGLVDGKQTFTIDILTDAADAVWESYKGRVVRGHYTDGSDDWMVFVRVDKSKGKDHWRLLCQNKQWRRIYRVVNAIEKQLKVVA